MANFQQLGNILLQILRLNICSRIGAISDFTTFNILEVIPSKPQDWDDFRELITSIISSDITFLKSKMGGFAGYGNSLRVAFPVMLD